MTRKNAGLAAILSFIFPGLGQLYNGDLVKAFLFILGMMLLGSTIGLALTVPLWIWAVVDAYNSTEEINSLNRIKENREKGRRGSTAAAI
ncbi:MAG: hypothetical protein Q7R35_13640 [Elusimicrobiota bacterium]|nr:hypothetical protein [Elusimicrobiota bacterium]